MWNKGPAGIPRRSFAVWLGKPFKACPTLDKSWFEMRFHKH
jgi:hypothetical protein